MGVKFGKIATIKKDLDESRNIFFDNSPTSLEKYPIETMWTCCTMCTEIEDCLSNLIDV